MPELILRGLPRCLDRDAWWLTATPEAATPAPPGGTDGARTVWRPGRHGALGALLLLVLLADWLFWDHPAGLSLALFAAAVLAATLAIVPQARGGRARHLGLVAIFALFALPVIETPQFLSVVFLLAGTLGATLWLTLGTGARLSALPRAAARLGLMMPVHGPAELLRTARDASAMTQWGALVRSWALPLATGLVFTLLLSSSNPITRDWAKAVTDALYRTFFSSPRPFFWLFVAIPLWPILVPAGIRERLERPFRRPRARSESARLTGRIGFNPDSVARSLVLFNLIFAVQTVLDLRYLWAGDTLPAGMSYAEYAHRGAYPLVATALLAGAFALASRPFAEGQPLLRRLLMLWIAQNVLLVLSSLYRLGLYVEIYGLTYLRAYAAIWMVLVAAGLASITWQVWRRRPNGWLLAVNGTMAVATLYLCCFVNFAQLIAAHNIAHDRAVTDEWYACSLGADAAMAIADHRAAGDPGFCDGWRGVDGPVIEGWRDWGFRSWRIRRYLAAAEEGTVGNAGEDPRRR